VRLPRDVVDELVAHAREDAPNECCGMVGYDGDGARVVRRVENAAHSPLKFQMDGKEQYDAFTALEDDGLEIAMYHSHTRSAPAPSQTDVNFAKLWPGMLWLIVGVAGDEPEVRGWWIEDGRVREAELEIG
jgi:[CysO sulfur-carrier protein]-S-L-cysteine hydrolase